MKATGSCLVLIGLSVLSGCTSIQVEPLAVRPVNICIEQNPKVLVTDFVSVVQSGLASRGIKSDVYMHVPASCEYRMTYVAYRTWDFVPYLSSADLEIWDREKRRVGAAHYHLRGKGGLSMAKWQGTETKMAPVLDQLLKDMPAR
ncbi:Sbal_3080 family lipoprotein [Pseudomonas sp. KFB-139]|uniref:Sbal_3080 family lipoprotein n=1 Tax=Pseudomonas serbiensis TaxID=3064350 RepID=A0ABT9CN73_9PSED|nr:Sbal_3080 family lipoprotein [Pseudomonas sp. KFB-138]MDO7926147.1 Sbal_3080 family lipoprotein [Pseudomonas sp. KFB-138]